MLRIAFSGVNRCSPLQIGLVEGRFCRGAFLRPVFRVSSILRFIVGTTQMAFVFEGDAPKIAVVLGSATVIW